jgi:hypothetical protein
MKKLTLFFAIIGILTSCENNNLTNNTAYIPPAPNYSQENMWFTILDDDQSGVDVFYIPSTWEFDWFTKDSVVCHYADITNQEHLDDMSIEMKKVADYMADGNRFYSPFYRHITLNTWATLNEDTICARYNRVSLKDIQQAFNYFLNNFNQQRPFILAGFSQGGKSVVELMKTMPENTRNRMVAAYVLGYKVTADDIAAAPWIKAAQDSIDTGVTICYNSVSDVKYTKDILCKGNVMCINPVNWRTDSTPATLHDTITVTLDTRYKVLVLDGFDGSYLPNILDIINTGDLHGIEPWVYSECLRKNIKQRIAAFWK